MYGSALDHVYFSSAFENKIVTSSIKNSSSDHLPVICEVRSIPKILPYTRIIKKRCLKNFSEAIWNETLKNQDWSKLENCNTVDEMVYIFTDNTNKALDIVAPFKSFQVKSNYKFGISPETKDLMRQRDSTRANIKKAKGSERVILSTKYKKLRNLLYPIFSILCKSETDLCTY